MRVGIAGAPEERASSARSVRLRHRDGSWRTFEALAEPLHLDARTAVVVVHLLEPGGERPGGRGWDALTGLPGRAALVERLQRSLARASREKSYGVAVMALDADRFKLVNASLGHRHGDQLLQLLAQRLAVSLRPGDMVARAGDDSFMLLVDHIPDLVDATRVATRVGEALASPFDLDGQEVFTTASIGITLIYYLPNSSRGAANSASHVVESRESRAKSRAAGLGSELSTLDS